MSVPSTERPVPTPEQVWKTLDRITERQEKTSAALDRLEERDRLVREEMKQSREEMRQSRDEARREVLRLREEAHREALRLREEARTEARQFREEAREQMRQRREEAKETDRRLRRAEDLFTSQWGRLMESLVEGDLAKLLQERNVEVETVVSRVKLKSDPGMREVDLVAMDGEDVVAAEVKTTLRPADVDEFLELLRDLPALSALFRDRRVYGGVAYLREHQGTARYAARKGLFVIRATGSSASIVNAPEFRPRLFHAPTA